MKRKEVLELYTEYNWKFFGGILPELDISFMELGSAYGYTIPDWSGMYAEGIILAKGMSDEEIRITLAHEMVHVWQTEKGHKHWDHGRKFYKKAKKICGMMGWDWKKF